MHDSPPCVLSARLSILAASLSQRRARASDGWDASAASRVPDALRHAMPLREKPGPSSISPRTSSAPQPRCAASGERVAVIARSTSCDEAIQPFGRGLWIASELALLAMTRDEAIALHSKVLRYLRPKQHEVGHVQPAQNAVDDCPEHRMLLV